MCIAIIKGDSISVDGCALLKYEIDKKNKNMNSLW